VVAAVAAAVVVVVYMQGQWNHRGYGGYSPPKLMIKEVSPPSFAHTAYEKILI